jgi:two-component system chemotaxis response regulator CheB
MHDSRHDRAQTLIVIGASAGGSEAIRRILSALPADLPAALAIALDTRPGVPPGLIEGWQAQCALTVSYAVNGEIASNGRVYVAPADQHLLVGSECHLLLDDGPRVRYSRPSVDRLFETAAQYFRNRTIGVILTGGDGDGAAGMCAITAVSGIGVVQEPSDSKDPSMPLTTLRTDHPRYCVPLREMAGLLSDLAARLA